MDDEHEGLDMSFGLNLINAGYLSIARSTDDPENVLTVALTERETGLLVLGLLLQARIFPEWAARIDQFIDKLRELGVHQGVMGGGESNAEGGDDGGH